ncbi:snurportin-1 [Phymastichus coffea]|uniref:snurportin-1 n=1 Tax=Phymastichus coffea TaxID=108790 RepID=UPI00273AAE53|nr:snurportin-1 [Phymastichus coffea]
MGTFICSKDEASCQKEPEFSNFANIIDKTESNNKRAALYKKPIRKTNIKLELEFNDTPQEIRRQRILHYQKKNRDEVINARRGLLEGVFNSDNEEKIEAEQDSRDMDVDPVRKKFYKVHRQYANLLMLSEWMLEVPQDFVEKWIMVPCPVGKRSLVVAYKGGTKLYSRNGKLIKKFKSVLPGGNLMYYKNNCTILDCVWDQSKEIFYILDVLAWSRQEMLYCETECRFFWIKSQIEELDEMKIIKKEYNDYAFELLPNISCDKVNYFNLENIVASMNLDGLLFYHKEVHYTSGKTPLVVWLKPYMLPEVLGMNVPAPYDEKPNNYINFEHHVLTVIKQEKEKTERKQQSNKRQSKSEQEDME